MSEQPEHQLNIVPKTRESANDENVWSEQSYAAQLVQSAEKRPMMRKRSQELQKIYEREQDRIRREVLPIIDRWIRIWNTPPSEEISLDDSDLDSFRER